MHHADMKNNRQYIKTFEEYATHEGIGEFGRKVAGYAKEFANRIVSLAALLAGDNPHVLGGGSESECEALKEAVELALEAQEVTGITFTITPIDKTARVRGVDAETTHWVVFKADKLIRDWTAMGMSESELRANQGRIICGVIMRCLAMQSSK